MAEAVVEERAPMPTRFYCHKCNVEINIPNTDYTCPICAGGFVEELPAHPPTGSGPSSSSSTSSISDGVSSDGVGLNRLNDLEALRGEIATLLMSRNGPNVEISIDSGNRRGNLLTLGGGGIGGGGGTGSSGSTISTGGGRVRPQNLDRLDNVLFDFLQSISGDVDAPFGNSQMFFMGNPGDYAWGREGIDTIVTQLLNQMETSGPPPLAKDKIAEIPKVEVTTEEVDRKLQCSVCWEDFRLQEIVRKLPCSHIYHENCIVPWLDLHGTCPICRKSLIQDADGAEVSMESVDDGSSGSGVGGLTSMLAARNSGTALHRSSTNSRSSNDGANATAASSNHGTQQQRANGNNTSQTQTQHQQHNNVFAFDDGNVDLD